MKDSNMVVNINIHQTVNLCWLLDYSSLQMAFYVIMFQKLLY